MDRLSLFQAALGIQDPWYVDQATFDPEQGRLDIHLEFTRGARFACPEGDEDACPVHDTTSKTWRHLDFFQHHAYPDALVPRVVCPEHGVRPVGSPRVGLHAAVRGAPAGARPPHADRRARPAGA